MSIGSDQAGGRSPGGQIHAGRGRRWWVAGGLGAGAAAYAGWVSGTTPFTDTAYVAVSAASLVLVAALVVRWTTGRRRGHRAPMPDLAPPGEHTDVRTAVLAWSAVVALMLAVEIVSYAVGGSRTLHPTVSSLVDDIDGSRAAKAALILAWMAGGWHLVWR